MIYQFTILTFLSIYSFRKYKAVFISPTRCGGIYIKEIFVSHDIDLAEHQIIVNKSWGLKLLVGMLDEIKKESVEKTYGFDENNFVFSGITPYHYNHYHKKYKEVFPELRIHSLRHSCAAYLIHKGVDIYLVKELMRHENIKETTNTYGLLYIEWK